MRCVLPVLISIHALRGEGDNLTGGRAQRQCPFLSTPSVGRATIVTLPPGNGMQYFYPRPPWGGRQSAATNAMTSAIFLSTPSVGRATAQKQDDAHHHTISIHALRGEGDLHMGVQARLLCRFLSTPSVGRATNFPTK